MKNNTSAKRDKRRTLKNMHDELIEEIRDIKEQEKRNALRRKNQDSRRENRKYGNGKRRK